MCINAQPLLNDTLVEASPLAMNKANTEIRKACGYKLELDTHHLWMK